jgi:hypothetical protein
MPLNFATWPRGWTGSRKSRREGEHLIRRLVYVAFFLEVGLLLVVLPWSSFWDNNYFVLQWPAIRPFLTNHFVRGGVTGLGGVNLVAGFVDLSMVLASRESRDATDQPVA